MIAERSRLARLAGRNGVSLALITKRHFDRFASIQVQKGWWQEARPNRQSDPRRPASQISGADDQRRQLGSLSARDRARAVHGFRSRRARRHQRDCHTDRRNESRQHHRRLRTWDPERSQGVQLGAPVRTGHRTCTVCILHPYANDRSGVSVAAGFVDFSIGRYSIVTAPGPGTPTQVKVFNYSLIAREVRRHIDVRKNAVRRDLHLNQVVPVLGHQGLGANIAGELHHLCKVTAPP
jgi:hypothetical protein